MNTVSTETYKVFGLQVQSELPLPELIRDFAIPEVLIRFASISEYVDKPLISGVCYQSAPNKFLLRVSGVACYLVENGNSITIDKEEGGSEDEIKLFLLGSAFGALIHQRGLLPFHGSAVLMNNKAIIFSGNSGAGKSTLAAGFINKGYNLIADDICVISLSPEGFPIVHPGYPQMKLWDDTLENLGHSQHTLRRIKNGIKKYAFPIHSRFTGQNVLLNGIYIISAHDTDSFQMRDITGIEKFNAINNNTYRLNFLKGCGTLDAHFKHIEAVSRLCFVKTLIRPREGFHLEKLMQLIEQEQQEVRR